MRYLSMRLMALCVVVPIVLYLLGMYSIEAYAQRKYSREIGSLYIGNTEPLFAGSIRLADAIQHNIDGYLKQRILVRMGLAAKVTVVTETGQLLYPAVFDAQPALTANNAAMQVARENYRLLNSGPAPKVDVALSTNSALSLGLLALCIFSSIGVLAFNYRRGLRLVNEQELRFRNELERLREVQRETSENMGQLERERARLNDKLQQRNRELESEKKRVSDAEDTMMEELVALEEKLQKNLVLQKGQDDQIASLKSEMERYKGAKSTPRGRHRQKEGAMTAKRFKALYKNISFHDRAAEGFASLTDDMKIKAEEVIFQLNQDPDMVVIKRKVFGKKNSATVFEVIFAYRGRLYFSRTPSRAIEVLAIGTKHSQDRDLTFLEKI